MPRPIQVRIDHAALRHNYQVARRQAAPAKVWAVVKANAYGHGLLRVARALGSLADGFALLDLADAVALREAGVRQPVLLLEGFFEQDDLQLCAEYGLITAVHCIEQLQMMRAAALPVRLPIYLKLNTGMNRLGFRPEQIAALRQELALNPAIGPITLMTHFADADGARGVDWQLACFQRMLADWPEAAAFPVSMNNSAALLHHPQTVCQWVRPGLMLYGGSPFAEASALSLGLKPVMTLESRVLAVQTVLPGERVGYGGTFTANRPMRVGVVACGYADGYPRHAPNGTPVLVAGQRSRILGRVSMDMLTCDLTDVPQAGRGSPVVLWGEGMPADAVATAAETVSYELFCALAMRVPVLEV